MKYLSNAIVIKFLNYKNQLGLWYSTAYKNFTDFSYWNKNITTL